MLWEQLADCFTKSGASCEKLITLLQGEARFVIITGFISKTHVAKKTSESSLYNCHNSIWAGVKKLWHSVCYATAVFEIYLSYENCWKNKYKNKNKKRDSDC